MYELKKVFNLSLMFLMKMKISKAHLKVRLDMSASILYLGVQERDGGV